MALFEASFSKPGAKECASRMIHAWDEDDICPSCIKPCFFAHECNPDDTQVTQHVPHVRQTIANSQLLHYLQEAHNPHTTHLQASNPVSFNTSFFLPTGGHSVSSVGDLSPIRQYHDDTDTQMIMKKRKDAQMIKDHLIESRISLMTYQISSAMRATTQCQVLTSNDNHCQLQTNCPKQYCASVRFITT
jgi:hypothetical protein